MSVIVKILIVLGVLVFAVCAAGVAMIGPRNLIGMLRYDQRREGALVVGDAAPDVELLERDGRTSAHLRDFIGPKPLVLVFGSYT